MPFVSSSIYKKATGLMLSEGLSSKLLDFHKDIKELRDGSKYIPMDLLLEVYELAEERLEAGFGVRQGKRLNSEDYGTLGLSWRTCWRAKDALDRVERFMVLVTDHGSARIEESGGMTKLIMVRDAVRKGLETANEASFVMLTGILKEITGKEIFPVEVRFKHPGKEASAYRDFFGCQVEFSQKENSIQFKTADIDVPTLKADKSIHQFLVERMDEEKKGIHTNADRLLNEIYGLIKEALTGGIPSIIQVADHLGVSARTLKRRLAEKELTFRELVQKIQFETSVNLLRNSGQSIAEIAFLTGFSEQSAFNRAFKRWTGKAPADYRKSAG